jgi:hypothetical protein
MGIQAFTPMGNTVTFTAATSAPSPVQAVSRIIAGTQYRIINTGTVVAFLSHGSTSSDASNNALIVTSSQFSIPLLPNTDEILTFEGNAYFTAITASGSAVIYITPGDGL